MFTHVLMTRFNLATPGRELAIRTQPGWLEGRFELFERYCLPSIAAQDTSDFHWIIYFDKDTPPAFKARIEELRKIFDFIPYYTGLFPSEGWRNSVNETFAPATPMLLTTRLDNDDALARDFVTRLHQAVRATGEKPGTYNFQEGLIRQESALYALRHYSNPFFSLLEEAGDSIVTAPALHHMKIHQEGKVYQIGGPPAWMQIVHETNVSNRVRGRRIQPEAAKNFAGEAGSGLTTPGLAQRLIQNAFAQPVRGLRDQIVGLLSRSSHRPR